MTMLSLLKHRLNDAGVFLRAHRVLLIVLVGLFVAGQAGAFLTGYLGRGGITGLVIRKEAQVKDDELRACSGQHTMFQDMETVDAVHKQYLAEMNAIFNEREQSLQRSETWLCDQDVDTSLPMDALKKLAAKLPGWSIALSGPKSTPVIRPVTVEAFSAIAAELQRDYECKLTELNDRALALMSRNKDISPGEFCCSKLGCAATVTGAECLGDVTTDSICNRECPVYLSSPEIAKRLSSTSEVIQVEKEHSRIALDRALLALRSMDSKFPIARGLLCYQRASLDLRNEFSLLADAVSCMPKIWDAVTSLHDRTKL
jgi:hypothetical protein